MQCACLHPDTPLLMSPLHHSKLTPTHLHSFKPQLKSYLLKEPFPDPSSKLLSPLYILSFPSMDLMQFVHRHYSCVYLMSICFRPSTTNSMTAGNGLTKAHCHKHHAQQSTWHITGTWIFGLNWVNKWLSIRHPQYLDPEKEVVFWKRDICVLVTGKAFALQYIRKVELCFQKKSGGKEKHSYHI